MAINNEKEKIQIVVLSNITLSPGWTLFKNKIIFDLDFLVEDVKFLDLDICFDKSIRKILEEADYVAVCINLNEKYSNIVNSVFENKYTIEELYRNIVFESKKIYEYLKDTSHAKIVWYGMEDFCYQYTNVGGYHEQIGKLVDRLNIFFLDEFKDVDFIDLKYIIATLGINSAYNYRNMCMWNMPYSLETMEMLFTGLMKKIKANAGKNPKCLVLDCDNVLWGGILDEDGENGILISEQNQGKYYSDFQKFLLYLYHHGVILTICSKNDEADIKYILNNHSGMVLKEKHIAHIEASWDNKSDLIMKISDCLGIILDSMVFIDDSDFEIQLVKNFLPNLKVIKFNLETIYYDLNFFNFKKHPNIKEIIIRNNTYKTNEKRLKLKQNCSTIDEFLDELEMQIDIHLSTKTELNRIANLTQRTNKCTIGNRLNMEQLNEKLQMSDYFIYSVYLKDKFSDLGLVGVMGIYGNTLDLFCLSCRALGRDLEYKMIEFLKEKGITKFWCIETEKNLELLQKLQQEFMLVK